MHIFPLIAIALFIAACDPVPEPVRYDEAQADALYVRAQQYAQRGEFTKAAETIEPIFQTHTDAKRLMGELREYVYPGTGEALLEEAASEYRAQLDAGDNSAHSILAAMYSNKNSPLHNPNLAFTHHVEAEKSGDENAIIPLAIAYREGRITPRNTGKAVAYYTRAAQAGHAQALAALYQAYRIGGWHKADDEQEFYWLKQHVEADIAHPKQYDHLLKLGMMYLTGDGTQANAAEAQHYFDKAVALRPERAQSLADALRALRVPHAHALAQRYTDAK